MTDELVTQPIEQQVVRQSEYEELKEQIRHALASGLLPSTIKTPQAALVIVLKGREIGIPMMQALSHINIISGKPTMSAELMLAQIYKNVPNAFIHFKTLSNEICEIDAARNVKLPKTSISFSMDDAKKAGVLRNQVWSKYPRAMLRSRAVSEMARTLFPDALCGVSYTSEELNGPVSASEEIELREV